MKKKILIKSTTPGRPKYDREYLCNKVAMMRIKGKSTRFLLEFLEEKVGMGRTTAYEVLRDAQAIVNEMMNKNIEDAYADSIARLEEQYESATDKRLKLQVLQELNKLQGLYRTQKLDITTNGNDINITEVVVKIIDSKNNEE